MYRKVCEAGQPCKSATCHSWPHFYGTGKFLWYYTWLLIHNLATCIYWILATVSSLVLCFLYKFNTHMLADMKSCIVFGQKSLFISRTAFYPFNVHHLSTSMDNTLEISSGNWPITVRKSLFIYRVMYLLSNLTTCLALWSLNLHNR
jgi:hypothetical protein